jgi:hypothetical protein
MEFFFLYFAATLSSDVPFRIKGGTRLRVRVPMRSLIVSFNLPHPSIRTMALRVTQPLTGMFLRSRTRDHSSHSTARSSRIRGHPVHGTIQVTALQEALGFAHTLYTAPYKSQHCKKL